MRNRTLMIAGCLGALLAVVAVLGWQGVAVAEHQCYFVRIEPPPKTGGLPSGRPLSPQIPRFYINPSALRVPVNTCVTWINWSRVLRVEIKFIKGLECRRAVLGASGFSLGPQNCFITYPLHYGCTASLVFTRQGVYDYVVVTKTEGKLAGRIVVLH